jgi:hypothetical protein
MISINPGQVTPALRSLFDPDMPTGIRCFAVLAGGNSGKILTDDPDRPLWAYVWEADDGSLYRGGAQERDVLQRVIAVLRQDGTVALGYRDGDPSVNLFPAEPDAGAACLEFDRPVGCSDLSPYLGALPAGYEIHRMERTLRLIGIVRSSTWHQPLWLASWVFEMKGNTNCWSGSRQRREASICASDCT